VVLVKTGLSKEDKTLTRLRISLEKVNISVIPNNPADLNPQD